MLLIGDFYLTVTIGAGKVILQLKTMIPEFDIPALLSLSMLTVASSVCGVVVVLRRQSMAVDTLTHSVLVGIVVAFMILGDYSVYGALFGGLISALLAMICVKMLAEVPSITREAATGIVLTLFFAAGIVLISVGIDSRIHLDADTALFGAIEQVYWAEASKPIELLSINAWYSAPSQVFTSLVAMLTSVIAILVSRRYLMITLFDNDFSIASGVKHASREILIALTFVFTAISAFETVGIVLAFALFCAPAAIAASISRSFTTMILVSVISGLALSITGYLVSANFSNIFAGAPDIGVAGITAFIMCLTAIILMVNGNRSVDKIHNS